MRLLGVRNVFVWKQYLRNAFLPCKNESKKAKVRLLQKKDKQRYVFEKRN